MPGRTDEGTEGTEDGDSPMSADGDGYVHRPSGEPPGGGRRTFDWRGWVLVAAVVVAFFLVPGAILVLPAAQDAVASLGLSLRDAYLVLPLVPAFALGLVAVWSAVRARASE